MDLTSFANQIRICALELCYRSRSSHIGGSFSVADILAALYGDVLSIDPANATDPARDRLYYSKGHASAALYAALSIRGFFDVDSLIAGFGSDGSYFTSHINHQIPGVELSTGSLGHALGVACGAALAAKRRDAHHSVFTILSDGELDEGSSWEAILFASHLQLDNLIAIVDYNKIQSFGTVADVMGLEPLAEKFRAFNWIVEEVNGHDLGPLTEALKFAKKSRTGRPKCVVAHTIKGKGVSFMENLLAWHYKSPNETEYRNALKELSGT